MHNKFKTGLVALTVAFSAASCIDFDAPSMTRTTNPPDWTKRIEAKVYKRSAAVKNGNGEFIRVSYSGTDIGDGLSARRTKRTLYIRDKNGVECRWGMADNLCGCTERNPAYDRYQAAKKAKADSVKAAQAVKPR